MEGWICDVVGRMHIHNVKQGEIAAHMGVRREHVNKILAGRLAPKGARERIVAALDEIIQQREQQTA